MVAFWGRNAEAIHIEHMVDVGSREPVVLLVMGCTCKKQDFLRLVGSVQPVEVIMERGRCFGVSRSNL